MFKKIITLLLSHLNFCFRQTMGFIIGATLGVAALLFMCSMFGRKLCKRGQASSQSNENSESDQGLIASSDKGNIETIQVCFFMKKRQLIVLKNR